ncbi:hypothetical protein BV898_01389 [Hypsibius exemplaris]|uniref:G-protein coupled receptors family 1 profile domain-containing protein n=1 Tax=Hypsibius exemplaris TaxID=2072580 RepID=A0A1W0XBB2_HYPEX|nr:hypothetical protein BV898_01389 [Hypsibius exemplaris]
MNKSDYIQNLTGLVMPAGNGRWLNQTVGGAMRVCNITVKARMAAEVQPLAFGTVITTTQLFNLIIFALWRGKEPYINLHVGLALTSLLAGLTLLAAVPIRLLVVPTDANMFLFRVFGFCLGMYTNSAAMIANFAISVDRWLSVEFAVTYRATVSKRKTLFVATVGVLGAAFLLATTGDALFWEHIGVDRCSRQVRFVGIGFASEFTMFWVFNGQFCLPLLFLTQLRVLMISAAYRLKRFRHRRQAAAINHSLGSVGSIRNVARPLQSAAARALLVRIVWSSLWASMTVICMTLIARLPYIILLYLPPGMKQLVSYQSWMAAGNMTFVMHYTTPLIYALLWPDYRKTVFRMCMRLKSVVTPHSSMA